MIFTITFNPSIDYIIHVPSFESGIINRTDDEKILPGGKGINVATVLTNFGHQCLALGFGAGSTGKMLRRELMARGIEADLVEAESGFTRINVKMKGDPETQINGQGPVISEKNMNDLYNRLSRLAPNDFVIVSGRVPASLGKTTYAKIGSIVEKSGGHFVVDAEGDHLGRPFGNFLPGLGDRALHVFTGLLHIAGIDADGGSVVFHGLVADLLNVGPGGVGLQQGMVNLCQNFFFIHYLI